MAESPHLPRTLTVLSVSQVFGGVGVASGIAAGGLLAKDITGSAGLAGLAQTFGVLGAAVLAVPLARLSAARGRRSGLGAGYLIAVIGALLAAAGGETDQFVLFLAGMLLFGSATSTGLQSRYAATDLAGPETRARALSIVVWATTIGAVLGPNIGDPAARAAASFGLPELTGPFLFSLVAFAVAAGTLFVFLRPDPLLEARRLAVDAGAPEPKRRSLADSFHSIQQSSSAKLALGAVTAFHTVMISVMVMTPVHMDDAGVRLPVINLVISIHIAGMFAFAPLVGWLADRMGRVAVLLLGAVVLLCAVAIAGSAPAHDSRQLALGLFLLGLGWSCGLVAGSTLLTDSVSLDARPGVQGLADLTMSGCGAIGGALAGLVVGTAGYGWLNVGAAMVIVPVLVFALRTGGVRAATT